MENKYIFVLGAPGSKWSSVANSIYDLKEITNSDYLKNRTYKEMHKGAYFDPGMEFGNFFNELEKHTKEQFIKELEKPFENDNKIRIIKSHCLSNYIDLLIKWFSHSPIIIVKRTTDSCFGWWKRAGGFNISYPDYKKYYVDDDKMVNEIEYQNFNLSKALKRYDFIGPLNDNYHLSYLLGLSKSKKLHNYKDNDIEVYVKL